MVGDVMGHGAQAAAVMAQLRAAARVLAQLDLEPADLLARLDQLIETLPGAPMATCLYAVMDPAGPLPAVRDALIDSLAERPEDDVTLILARIPRLVFICVMRDRG